ncbi:hypothetical protein HMPREF0724_14558 [Prescottella equi ATCC 33707]|uniref:Uncharacterized protein n=1 Tax=Prescottella equi ATCC 33707 TaxID=525370 RepID=E9T702_RHOHA|nr:hypothetical protein HMPREF0724_14558 [Prescottella equi ATCC 33707]
MAGVTAGSVLATTAGGPSERTLAHTDSDSESAECAETRPRCT